MSDKKQQPAEALTLKPDKIFSTYWWRMHLDETHPHNSVKYMDGYSKFQNHDEPRDKRELLMKKIIMLHSTAWLSKSTEIEIRCRIGDILIKDQSLWMITLRRKDCSTSDKLKLDQPFILFLDKFYRAVKSGENVRGLIPMNDKKFSKDDYLDPLKQFSRIGTNEQKLDIYFRQLLNNGHSVASAMSFFNRYKEKYFTSQNSTSLDAI